MYRIALAILFGVSLACQSPTASENSYSSSEEPVTGETIDSATDVVSRREAVQQKVQQLRQLQTQLRSKLDSLYALDNTAELSARTDTLESAYFALADTEAKWEKYRTQYSDQFDSLASLNTTAEAAEFDAALDSLEQQLQRSIAQAESLLLETESY